MKKNILFVMFVAASFRMYGMDHFVEAPKPVDYVPEKSSASKNIAERATSISLQKSTIQKAIPKGGVSDMVDQINSVFSGKLKLQDQSNLAKAINDVNSSTSQDIHVQTLETLLNELGKEYGNGKNADEILKEMQEKQPGNSFLNYMKLQMSHVVNTVYSGGARVSLPEVQRKVSILRENQRQVQDAALAAQLPSQPDSSPPSGFIQSDSAPVDTSTTQAPVDTQSAPPSDARTAQPLSPEAKRAARIARNAAPAASSVAEPAPEPAASRPIEVPVARKTNLEYAEEELAAAQAVDLTRIPKGPLKDAAARRIKIAEANVEKERYLEQFRKAEEAAATPEPSQAERVAAAENRAARARADLKNVPASSARESEFQAGYRKFLEQKQRSYWGDPSMPSSGPAKPSPAEGFKMPSASDSGSSSPEAFSRDPIQEAYAVFGLPESATPDQVRKAYLQLARDNHPDKTQGDLAKQELFKKVSVAYETIQNSLK